MPGNEQIAQNAAAVSDALGADEGQLVVFRLLDEEFGVVIDNVKEIVRLPDITPIPRSPDYVAGICNLRGNVLPAIDTRTRFSMDTQDATDHTRLLVVDTGGVQTGLIVDSVREVMRLNFRDVEPPPPACRGIEREFLSGVVKVDQGERLILNLNLNEVLSIDIAADDTQAETGISMETAQAGAEAVDTAEVEEQLVSFHVAGDEYAFNIDKVREILKIREVTSVPNVPDYVKGLFTIRNNLLPILDLRELLGLPTLISERHAIVDIAVQSHRTWVDTLRHALEAGTRFTGQLAAKQSTFGVWLEGYNTSSVEVETVVKRLKRARVDLFGHGAKVLELRETSPRAALEFFEEKIESLLSVVLDTLEEFKTALAAYISEDQRALVVESNTMTIGYLVDGVDEVTRIPRSVIDETPAMASSSRKELKAVAKLDDGARLIMIMDESALVSEETSRVLTDIKSRAGKADTGEEQERTLEQQSLDEEQLVTFGIASEEYGIRIMQVQEINRASEITHVPRAPYFVDGMTNLRGSVIPVINIRKLFGMDDLEIDDRTRIIIVEMDGSKTGLRVDRVNEVLRLDKRAIDITPSIILSGGANKYMEGVCKIDAGKRIVVLLNVEKILDEKELLTLSKLKTETDQPKAKKKAEPKAAAPKKTEKQEKPEKKKTAKKPAAKGKKLEIAE